MFYIMQNISFNSGNSMYVGDESDLIEVEQILHLNYLCH